MKAKFEVLFHQESAYLDDLRSTRYVVVLERWTMGRLARYVFVSGFQYPGESSGYWEWDDSVKYEVWQPIQDAALIRRAIRRYDEAMGQYEPGSEHEQD